MISRPPNDLSGWRVRTGLSLAAIAEATKISTRYLEAIERGKFSTLPGGVYGVNYIRQYARAIHYREDDLVEYYRRIVIGTPPSEARAGLTARVRELLRRKSD